jgi:hypothetical protein
MKRSKIMEDKHTTFYLPLYAGNPDIELKITVETRFYNGIASDPRTITRAPSIHEMQVLQAAMRKTEPGLKWSSMLDYPPAHGL